MYHFALCDDEEKELNKINSLLTKYREVHIGCDFTVENFTSMNSLLDTIKSGVLFDILLLDIYLPDKTGIEAAYELRESGCDCPIIFLTTSKEHALDAFGVQPVHYLVKPVAKDAFFAAMEAACQHINAKQHNFIVVKTDGGLCRIAVGDIIFCESHNNYQHITLTNKTCVRSRMTSTKIFELLSQYSAFVRCGVAYVVNLDHVVSIATKEMLLDNNTRIAVPRGAYTVLKKQYFAYYYER